MPAYPHPLNAATTWQDLVAIWAPTSGGHVHLRVGCPLRERYSTAYREISVAELIDALRSYEDEPPWLTPCRACALEPVAAFAFRGWPDASTTEHPRFAITCSTLWTGTGRCETCLGLADHFAQDELPMYRTDDGHYLLAGRARADLTAALATGYSLHPIPAHVPPVTPELLKAAWVTRAPAPVHAGGWRRPCMLHFDVAAAVLEPAANDATSDPERPVVHNR